MRKENAARNTGVDSIKGALIVLVVLGHLLTMFIGASPLYRSAYAAIYLFHMPLFIMIGGMFSRAQLGDKDYGAILTRLLIPLLLFEVPYVALDSFKTRSLADPPLEPHWIMWFLLAMIIWKLLLPLLARMAFPILIAVALTLAAGFNPEIGGALSLSRAFYFFPFFLFGYFYRDRILDIAVRFRGVLALVFAASIAIVVIWTVKGLPVVALYGASNYAAYSTSLASAPLERLLLLLLSLCGALGFAGIVPDSRILAYLGERSLAIYLLHGFAVRLTSFVLHRLVSSPGPVLIPALAVLALLIAFAAAPFDAALMRLYARISRLVFGAFGEPDKARVQTPS